MTTKTQIPMPIGMVVKLVGATLHQVEYAIKSRDIQPACRLGNCNLYDVAAIEQIREALREIAVRRAGR